MLQKPTPLITSSTGNLLRCFVRRDPGGDRAVAKFSLYLGQEHNQPEACKFLMAALLNSRCDASLHFTLLRIFSLKVTLIEGMVSSAVSRRSVVAG